MPSRVENSVFRRVFAVLVFAAVGAAAVAAHADDAAPLPPPPRVNVSAEGPDEAVLEERAHGWADRDEGWRQLCYLPCNTVVTPDPYAEHRIVDGTHKRSVEIRGLDGERVVLKYARAPKEGTALLVGGIVVGGAGLGLVVGGIAKSIGNIGSRPEEPCRGDASCERRLADSKSADHTAQTLTTVGGLMFLAGGAGVVLGALTSKSSAMVSSHENDRARAPAWSRPDLPKPPNHTNMIELHF
jgi:hypothetical protein